MSIDRPPEQFTGYTEFTPSRVETWCILDDGRTLDVQIHEPAEPGVNVRNAMVFFFGGGWRQGSPWQFAPYAAHLARQGWVVLLPEYRVRATHDTTPIDAALDARAFMRWLAANAERFGADPAHLYAGGGSAGAHLAASLPVTSAIDDHPEAARTPLPRALVLFNPAVNFDHPEGVGRRGNVTKGLGVTLDELLTVDPLAHAKKGYPPTLILHGSADEIVPVAAVEAFASRLQALAIPVHMVVFEGRQHGFFNLWRNRVDFEATLTHLDDFLSGIAA